MIVDMHVHTMISSTCSMIDPDECIEAALALGLDAICVTEHETHEGGRVMKELGESRGFRVFAGMEVMSREGHLLVYGYGKDIKGVQPAADVIRMVEAEGGLVAPAHPWRSMFGWYSGSIERDLADTEFAKIFTIIEMYNGLNTVEQNKKAEAFCAATGIRGIGGSDAHVISGLGVAVTEFEDEFEDERGMVAALKSGNFKARIIR